MSDLPIPGSVYLVDVAHSSHHQHASGKKESVVLSPVPSRDVNDPLNWSRSRKMLAQFCLLVYTMTAGIGGSALYSVITPISQETGISVSVLNAGTGYMFLLLGWGALINQPLALTFGKRGVYLVSLLGSAGCCFWMPYITTDAGWLANKVLQGFFVTPSESLIEVSITDLFFAHERGLYISIYALTLFGSNFVGPLIAGFIYEAQGWKWVMYWSSIISMIGFAFCFIFMEETNYVRGTTEANEHEEVSGSAAVPATDDDMKKTENTSAVVASVRSADDSLPALEGTPHTFLRRMLFFNKKYMSLSTSGLMYGTCLVIFNILNATASIILSAPPYNFKASSVGLMYLGPIIGVILGSLYSGWFGDKFSLWFARRRKGVRESEDRLWLMSFCCVLCPTALILWGVGAAKEAPWAALAVGFAMSSMSTGIGSSLALGYVLDSYKDLSGETMMSVILVRNSLSFAIGYAITPWLTLGLQNTFVSAAMIGLAINLSFLIVIKWGKTWRSASRVRYWGYVATSAATGH